jgi:hypothetical protein
MICQNTRKFLSVMLGFVLVTASAKTLYGYQAAASPPAVDSGNPTDPAPQSAAELQDITERRVPFMVSKQPTDVCGVPPKKLSIGRNYTTGVNSLHSMDILICKVGDFTYSTLI